MLGVLGFRFARTCRQSPWFDGIALVAFFSALLIPTSLATVLAIGLFVPALALSSGPMQWVLSTRPFVTLGLISYAIYMIHFPIAKIVQNINAKISTGTLSDIANIIFLLFWILFVMVLAYFSYRFIERPARIWIRQSFPHVAGPSIA